MKFAKPTPARDRHADRPINEFPAIDGSCAAPVPSVGPVPISELIHRGTRLAGTGFPVRAARCFHHAMRRTRDLEQKARLALSLGGLAETIGKYRIAIPYYRATLALSPANAQARYFARNNLGYSLNRLGLHREAEIHCRDAICVNPRRANGYKNLGLSLWGQGRSREAAACFVVASQVTPLDTRSVTHLRDLLASCPEIVGEFAGALEWCRRRTLEVRNPRLWTKPARATGDSDR